jgi:hypothetical protein
MPTRTISILQKYQHFYEGILQSHDGIPSWLCAAYLMIVTGLRIHASWVMCNIDC